MNPVFLTDSYKVSHYFMTPKGVKTIYSNLTPRFTKYFKDLYPNFDDKIVWFGLQYFIKDILIKTWNDGFFKRPKKEVMKEIHDVLGPYIGFENSEHFAKLHDLGYLPIIVKALPEGMLVNPGIPVLTITNTHPDYQWLPNYLETIISAQVWKPMTVATIGKMFRTLSNKYAIETTGSTEGVEFQNHDFSFRGQSDWESSGATGAAFLLSTSGTDNVPALLHARDYYNADLVNKPIAFSVPASEHSVTTLGIQKFAKNLSEDNIELSDSDLLSLGEVEYVKFLLNKFQTGLISYVADSYDYWGFLQHVLPQVKETILKRDGKYVVRPDSGNPVDIICGKEIIDLSDAGSLEIARVQALGYEQPNLTCEISTKELIFKYEGKIYKCVVNFSLDEYNQIDSFEFGETSETTLTIEQKGSVEWLYELFGGTVNEQGYKVLDSHIGLIYGDGITYDRAQQIFERLKAKGFATTNVVFGIGSYTIASSISRDSLGVAIKATGAEIENSFLPIYKDPKTDTSKKSAKGYLKVVGQSGSLTLIDNVSKEEEDTGLLRPVFKDGKLLVEEDFYTIKERLWNV